MSHRSLATLVMAAVCVVSCSDAWADGVRFIHITDPHIFDGNADAFENAAAFDACIKNINERIEKQGANYQFAVVTGDLGLEGLFDGGGKADGKLQNAAADLAAMIARSKVKRWLFLPGNNDLYDELPYTIGFYHDFLKTLNQALETLAKEQTQANQTASEKITVVDLCPVDNDVNSGVEILGDYAFLGFNNASFKNNNSLKRAQENAAEQEHYVTQVSDRLKNARTKFAYVFYHVPEIDDPYWASLPPDNELLKQRQAEFKQSRYAALQNPYVFSAWVVHHEVRDLWGKIVSDDRVKGLFAGHFHDSRIKTYEDFNWMRTSDYPYDSRSKLQVCPPISVKFQYGTETARGFQEILLNENGNVERHLLWYRVLRTIDDVPVAAGVALSTTAAAPEYGISLSRMKETVEFLATVLTLLAIIFGGSWSYVLFIRTRQKYPSANISQGITYREITADKLWVRVTVTLQNTGKVLLSLVSGVSWIQQVAPLDAEISEKIKNVEDPVSQGGSEIIWPLVEERKLSWGKGEREIEPSESDQIYFDFVVDSDLRTIVVYSYFTNVKKFRRRKGLGWQIARVYDLRLDAETNTAEDNHAPSKATGETETGGGPSQGTAET